MLHIFSHHDPAAIQQQLPHIQHADAVSLIGDATYLTTTALHVPGKLYVLTSDLAARGLAIPNATEINCIDYADFVTLTEQHKKIVHWSVD